MANIDRNLPIPIYHQLRTIILEQINSGVWRAGDRIPTEQDLCRLYGISRAPVRQALNELTHEGVLFRRPGLGTFVEGSVATDPAIDTPIQMMGSDPHWPRVLDHVAETWNANHPNLRITFQANLVNHNEFYDTLSAAVGSGTAPDVAMVDGVWVAGLARSGFLYALEDQDLGFQWNHTEFVKDLYAPFVKANSFSGKLYGLPAKADASLLWYRQDWFAQERLDPPRDWDDLLAVASHFTQPEVQERYGLAHPLVFPGGTAGGEATVYTLMPFVWSAGSEIFDARTGAIALNTPGTRRALLFLRELVALHRVSPHEVVSYNELAAPELFARGKAAMALGGSYESESILEISGWSEEGFRLRVGYVAPPAAPGGLPASTVGGTSYVILRQCPSPKLVMDILKMATDSGVVGDLYRSMLQNLPCPSFDGLLDAKTNPLLTQTLRMIASGHARPSIPEYVKVSRQLQTMFEVAISGTAPVAEIARRAAEFIGAISEKPVIVD